MRGIGNSIGFRHRYIGNPGLITERKNEGNEQPGFFSHI